MATPSDELKKLLERRRVRADGDELPSEPSVPRPSTPDATADAADAAEGAAAPITGTSVPADAPADIVPGSELPPVGPTLAAPTVNTRRATSLEVSWSLDGDADMGSASLAYELQYCTSGVFSMFSSWLTAAAQHVGPMTFTVNDLTAGTAYVFRVRSSHPAAAPSPYNWGAWSASSEAIYTLTDAEEEAFVAEQTRIAEEEATQAAEKLRRSQEEFTARKAKEESERRRTAELDAQRRAKESARLQAQIEELKHQRELLSEASQKEAASLDARRAEAEAAAEKLRKETEKLASERIKAEKAAAAQLAKTKELEEQLAQLTIAREQQIKEEQERLASMSEKAKREAAAAAAAREEAEAKAAALADEVSSVRAKLGEMESNAATVSEDQRRAMELLERQLEAVEAEKTRAAEEVSALSQSESKTATAAREASAERDQLLARIHAVEDELRITKVRAQMGDAAAADATDTIIRQEEHFEELVRYLRYKDALLKSLQGAGPNPKLETDLVSAGFTRENVRFFMEVHGENRKTLQVLLERHKTLVAEGHDPDGVREALVVTEGADDSVLEYLKDYDTNTEQRKKFESMLADSSGLRSLLMPSAPAKHGGDDGAGAGAGSGSGSGVGAPTRSSSSSSSGRGVTL